MKQVSEERGRPFLLKFHRHALLVKHGDTEPLFVRGCGLEAAEVRWLHAQGLVALGDTLSWNVPAQATTAYEDRYVIAELTAKGEELIGV